MPSFVSAAVAADARSHLHFRPNTSFTEQLDLEVITGQCFTYGTHPGSAAVAADTHYVPSFVAAAVAADDMSLLYFPAVEVRHRQSVGYKHLQSACFYISIKNRHSSSSVVSAIAVVVVTPLHESLRSSPCDRAPIMFSTSQSIEAQAPSFSDATPEWTAVAVYHGDIVGNPIDTGRTAHDLGGDFRKPQ